MSYPSFATGEVLTAADMNAVGLWLVKTVTVGTGVSSVPVTDAFSAAYDNYKIVYTGGNMSVSTALKLQVGNAVTGYYGAYIYGQNSGAGPFVAPVNNESSFVYAGGNSDTISTHLSLDLLAPFLSQQTAMASHSVHYSTNFGSFNGVLANTSSYTGFTLIPFSGTMTGGTIRVYGYRN
jgi:hypothetical protein